MNKEEFKKRWESNENGGGITNQDIAECYIKWGLGTSPYTKPIHYVIWKVCEYANTNDKNEWKQLALKGDNNE